MNRRDVGYGILYCQRDLQTLQCFLFQHWWHIIFFILKETVQVKYREILYIYKMQCSTMDLSQLSELETQDLVSTYDLLLLLLRSWHMTPCNSRPVHPPRDIWQVQCKLGVCHLLSHPLVPSECLPNYCT